MLPFPVMKAGTPDMPFYCFHIEFLCGLCLPDLKIIQAGEKPDCRQAGFVFPLRLFLPQRALRITPA